MLSMPYVPKNIDDGRKVTSRRARDWWKWTELNSAWYSKTCRDGSRKEIEKRILSDCQEWSKRNFLADPHIGLNCDLLSKTITEMIMLQRNLIVQVMTLQMVQEVFKSSGADGSFIILWGFCSHASDSTIVEKLSAKCFVKFPYSSERLRYSLSGTVQALHTLAWQEFIMLWQAEWRELVNNMNTVKFSKRNSFQETHVNVHCSYIVIPKL